MTDTTLRTRIEADYRTAMKAREPARLSALRMLRDSIQKADKSQSAPLSDDALLALVGREIRIRRESISEFERGNRPDLAVAEHNALAVLAEYQPAQLSDEDLRAIVAEELAELNFGSDVNSRAAMGIAMKAVMPKLKGKADGERISRVVSAVLGQDN